MPKFVTIGYGDQAGYDRTPVEVRNAAHAHEAELQKQGVLMGIAGRPVQARNPEAKQVQVDEGPYLRADLPIAGFAIIDAVNLEEAVKIAAEAPCAIAHGVVEVWPLQTPDAPGG